MADVKKTAKIVLNKIGNGYDRAKKIGGSLGFILTLAVIIHLWDVLNSFRDFGSRLTFYILLTVFAWATIFQKEVGVMDVENLKIPLILSSIAVIVPYLGNVLPFLNNLQIFQTLIIFCPAWVIYILFALGSETPYTKLFRWGVIIFWVVLFVPTLVSNLAVDLHLSDVETGINVQQTISNAGRDFSFGVKNIFNNIGKGINDFVENLIKIGAGDYYTGKVDEYENEPVGVYLEDLQAADPKFFEGEKITVWAVLKAKTLDKEININVSCYAKEGDKKVEGSITPQNEFSIATEEEEYLDCAFDNLNPGKRDVTFHVEFNFETMAYLKTYFMEKESLRALTREGIDVFNHYKISYINPIAVYTNGPVGIGMKTAEPLPVGVYINQENIPFFFGITIENNWEGTIKKITGLEVQVHDSLELTNCDEFEFKENKDGYNIYSLIYDEQRKNPWWQNIAEYYTIQCRLNPVDPKSLLGNEPITTRYFRVTASYVYELEKSVPVEVEKVEDYKSPEGEVMSSDEKTQEFKDKLNEVVDGKTNKDIACEEINECSEYDDNYYSKLGFSNQEWCDTDPCNLNCYSNFNKEGGEIYYADCNKCPQTIYCGIYLSKDYCEKDSCKFSKEIECNWDGKECNAKITNVEDGKRISILDTLGEYENAEQKIRAAASYYEIPEGIALGIAQQESDMKHYDTYRGTEIVKSNTITDEEGNTIIIGIMQIALDKNSNYCSACSKTKEELKDINTNIECGMKILKDKYNLVCDASGNTIMRDSGKSAYQEKVEYSCKNSMYVDKYLKYDGNCWDMAIRAYNGLGCIPKSEGGYAEINYVEEIRENMKMFS